MDGLLATRLGFVGLCIGAAVLLAIYFEDVARALKAFFFEPTQPINLGVLRAVTFAIIFNDARGTGAEFYAALPPGYVTLPQGWSWFGELLPITLEGVIWAKRALLVSAALATVGLFTRPMSILAALLAVYVLGIPNFYFQIGHGTHVQVLSGLVLAASPAGDAFSVDGLVRKFRGRTGFPPDAAYTIPVRFCWLLIGTMYLFPGLWKLWEAGDLWITGDKLAIELLKKWGTMPEFVPPFRLDQQPRLLAVFGTLTLLFEIGFFFALFRRSTRVVAALAATCFHYGIWLNMNIWFRPLYPLLLLLEWPQILPARLASRGSAFASAVASRIPLPSFAKGLSPMGAGAAPPARSLGASFVVGSILVFAMFVAGFSPIDSWPIAVYPRFATRLTSPPRTAFALSYKLVSAQGVERDLKSPLGDLGESVTYRITRELLQPRRRGQHGKAQKYVALMAHLVRSSSEPLEPGARLLVYRYDFPTDPDERRTFEPEFTLVAETEL